MKGLERLFYAVVILTLIILLFRRCNRKPEETITTKIEVKYDTIKGESKVSYVPIRDSFYVTSVDSIEKITYVQIPVYITDSGNFVKRNTYTDTLRFDTLGYAVVKDTVAGELLKRAFSYEIIRPTITITNTVPQKKGTAFYVGGEAIVPVNYFGVGAGMKLKNDDFIKLGYGVVGSKQQIGFSYFKKIKL